MNDIIDAHCHVYPQKIALKAAGAIGSFYGVDMSYDGTAETLLEEGKKSGVTRFLVHSVATSVKQVASINEFLLQQAAEHREFIPFMTLHPDMSEGEISSEIERGVKNGFYGIKLHPDFQRFNVDGTEGMRICAAAEGRLPILFHVGDDRFDFSAPQRIVKIAKAFPSLTIIAAHFGGYRCWQNSYAYEGIENVYFDTSSSLAYLSQDEAQKLISFYGANRFLFGTDYPMWSAESELNRLNALGICKEEKELILHENAERILKLR